ncbi:MAG TPA: class I SAM-dependent methyltransferase [Solirubrobacteraceae bacterium]|nr:class I SAM-dependent methyltransferase [Solirubrobacteraceae bacterium]
MVNEAAAGLPLARQAADNARRVGGALRRRLRRTGPPLPYAGVAGRIHPDDDMLHPGDPDAAHYARVGASAVAAIERALSEADRAFGDVRSCLDMPCGYGRVLRRLAQEISPERITACDINRRAIRFCAREFGVTPLRSTPSLDCMRLGRHDLIWCGSLVTHLDEWRVAQLLRSFCEALEPGGLAIVTIHAEPPASGEFAPLRDEIGAALEQRGEFHVAYENALFDYGHAWHTPEYLSDAVSTASAGHLRLVSHQPRGWDDHQDVLAFQRDRPLPG